MNFRKIAIIIFVSILIGLGGITFMHQSDNTPKTLEEAVYRAYKNSEGVERIEELYTGEYRYIVHYKDGNSIYITENGVQSYNKFLSNMQPLNFINK